VEDARQAGDALDEGEPDDWDDEGNGDEQPSLGRSADHLRGIPQALAKTQIGLVANSPSFAALPQLGMPDLFPCPCAKRAVQFDFGAIATGGGTCHHIALT
jgi:hypothetical protein